MCKCYSSAFDRFNHSWPSALDHCVRALSLVPIALVPEQAYKVLYNKKKVRFGVLVTVHVEGTDYSVLRCDNLWFHT